MVLLWHHQPLMEVTTSELNNVQRKDYTRNNVSFRIVSSKAIAEFKNSQAFMFTQLTEGKYKFADTPKELLLLLYDNWFRWIVFLERYCLFTDTFTEHDIKKVCAEGQSVIDDIYRIANTNASIFDAEFIDTWIQTQKAIDEYVFIILEESKGKQNIEVFPQAVTALILMLNSSLFVLHEIDSLLYAGRQFVSIDKLVIELYNKNKSFLPSERFIVYRSRSDINELDVKCYVPSSCVENNDFETIYLPLLEKEGAVIKDIIF